MKNITFKQFMLTYNFRYYNENGESDSEREDTTTIRINYYPDEDNDYYYVKWFEFGMYDYETDYHKLEHLKQIFSDFILNSYINSFYHNETLNILEVYLTNKKNNDEV